MQTKTSLLGGLRPLARNIVFSGNARYCPVCGASARKFRKFGVMMRDDAMCYHCGSLERHRFAWLYFQNKTNLFNCKPKKMLHVAPEACFESQLSQLIGDGYLTADLQHPNAMVKMDIMDIQYPDETFDVIYCSHVLEHVDDDRKAMREFHRVLKKDGWAILLVPILGDETFEDPAITDPIEREKIYGQKDHVRKYGPDYVNRLRDAGFTVTVTSVSDMFKPEEAKRIGLAPISGEIYYCTK
jgi:SAM-dependent methyltransferase